MSGQCIFSMNSCNRLPEHAWGGWCWGKKPVAYIFEPHVAGEEGLQAHIPVLPAPQDAMTALREAHVAAPGLLQLRVGCRARAHQHLQALHTEAPVPGVRGGGMLQSLDSPPSYPTFPRESTGPPETSRCPRGSFPQAGRHWVMGHDRGNTNVSLGCPGDLSPLVLCTEELPTRSPELAHLQGAMPTLTDLCLFFF